MRKGFEGHYRPTTSEFDKLWKNAWIIPDTNVLLNTYRYRVETREALLELFERFGGRMWIPHRVALEYHDTRVSVISAQVAAYQNAKDLLEKYLASVRSGLNSYRKHPAITIEEVLQPIEVAISAAIEKLDQMREAHPDLLRDDPIRDRLTEIFEGKVGLAFAPERLDELTKDADRRIAALIPPGFKDSGKNESARRGDVFLWLQILDHAKKTKRPVILVTDDAKDDWWFRHEGKTLGPRPELRQELRSVAGVDSYMYLTDRFVEEAQRFLKVTAQKEAVAEIRELREKTESAVTAAEALAEAARSAGPYGVGSPLSEAILDAARINLPQSLLDSFKSSMTTNAMLNAARINLPQSVLDSFNSSRATNAILDAARINLPQSLLDSFKSSMTTNAMLNAARINLPQSVLDSFNSSIATNAMLNAPQLDLSQSTLDSLKSPVMGTNAMLNAARMKLPQSVGGTFESPKAAVPSVSPPQPNTTTDRPASVNPGDGSSPTLADSLRNEHEVGELAEPKESGTKKPRKK